MTIPNDYAITIKINDVDVTNNCPFSELSFADKATEVSNFKLKVENPANAPLKGQSVEIIAKNLPGTFVVFFGLILKADEKKRDDGLGTTLEYFVEAADTKVRAQKSIVSFNDFFGTDASILSALLAATYPDLSSLLDFSTGVTPFANDLALLTNDDNLLDSLGKLADLAGANYRFENALTGGDITVNFEAGGHSNFSTASTQGGWVLTTTGFGNGGGNAFRGTLNPVSTADSFEIEITFDNPIIVQTLNFDFFADSNDDIASVLLEVSWDGFSAGLWFDFDIADSTWVSVDWNDQDGFGDGFDREIFPAYITSTIKIRLQVNVGGSGSWDIRFNNIVFGLAAATAKLITFDVGGDSFTTSSTNMDSTAEEAGGNPGNTFRGTTTSTSAQDITVTHDLGADTSIFGIGAHLKYVGPGSTTAVDLEYEIRNAALSVVSSGTLPGALRTNDWFYIGKPFQTPIVGQHIDIILGHQVSVPAGSKVYHIDNMIIVLNAEGDSVNVTGQELRWNDTPELTDFNLDIQTGDEFGFGFDLFEGDIDDFNSITVIGGIEEVVWDKTYESRGEQDHFDLELPVKSIAVFKNTGTDPSPIWTAQTLGAFGTDDLTRDGGNKDVIYDDKRHWLEFNTNPVDLAKSIRVTGFIEKPIRIRLEDAEPGEPIFATVVHDDRIRSTDDAVARAQSELDKRNGITRLEFTTYEPGLKPGQAITVEDSTRGLSETLVIQSMSTKWIGDSGHAQFSIVAGNEENTGLDVLIANNDKRSRQRGPEAAIPAGNIVFVVDTDGTQVVDIDGALLYEVTT